MSKRKPNPKIVAAIGIVAAVAGIVFIITAFYHASHPPTVEKTVSQQKLKDYAAKHHAKTVGNDDAKVKIYAFEDMQCPDCKKFHEDIINGALKDDIYDGKVNYTMLHHNIINKYSPQFAHMADIIQKNNSTLEYIAFVDKAYEHQDVKNPEMIVEMVPEITNKDALMKEYNKVKDEPMSNDGSKAFGVDSTPTVFVNGKEIDMSDMDNITKEVRKEEAK